VHPTLFQIAARMEASRLPRIAKSATAMLQKVDGISERDAEKLNLAETAKIDAHHRIHYQKHAGMQLDA
jgi:Holliday junction resolvasome RuvABC DNA-binding subunit